jgi:hypothetical protein
VENKNQPHVPLKVTKFLDQMEQLRDRMSSTDPREAFWVERQRLVNKSPLVIDKQLPTVVQRLYETVTTADNQQKS